MKFKFSRWNTGGMTLPYKHHILTSNCHCHNHVCSKSFNKPTPGNKHIFFNQINNIEQILMPFIFFIVIKKITTLWNTIRGYVLLLQNSRTSIYDLAHIIHIAPYNHDHNLMACAKGICNENYNKLNPLLTSLLDVVVELPTCTGFVYYKMLLKASGT